jgi:hypothetical protein
MAIAAVIPQVATPCRRGRRARLPPLDPVLRSFGTRTRFSCCNSLRAICGAGSDGVERLRLGEFIPFHRRIAFPHSPQDPDCFRDTRTTRPLTEKRFRPDRRELFRHCYVDELIQGDLNPCYRRESYRSGTAAAPAPPTRNTFGTRASGDGRAGNSACGSV